ncbi:predicted protein [Chaetomium globosum CBS 148.51]|uniref:RiboL-PSP-HEPN domain-containing protein n=1 Tax=Chaetomium globosum (strain ATCC 6205 / CBS 148.51 / DSM 1962 / NBRC 6347 / NRRL 1970) TaxID=306901 RepID=Q2GMX7_CHAGB|nr:uncharacterized protein CHGG_10677 [Chaetomium globosum CBS 148.51]EAQ84273.1 predicted protein [Chaetomium globosum CBS 148.51]
MASVSPEWLNAVDRAHNVVADAQKKGHLDAKMKDMADRILRVVKGPAADAEPLNLAVDSFEGMHQSKCNYDGVMFMLRMSDWPSEIIKTMRSKEPKVAKAQLNEQAKQLRGKGVSDSTIKAEREASKDWSVIRRERAGSSYSVVKGNIDKLTSYRNAVVHNSPPDPLKYLKDDETIDWIAINQICETQKRMVRADQDEGLVDEDQVNLFVSMIDGWFALYIEKWSNNGQIPYLTAYGIAQEKAASDKKENERTKTEKKDKEPWSIYVTDKWDYLSGVSSLNRLAQVSKPDIASGW